MVNTSKLLSTVCEAWSAQPDAVAPAGCLGAAPYKWRTWQEAATVGVGAGVGVIAFLLLSHS